MLIASIALIALAVLWFLYELVKTIEILTMDAKFHRLTHEGKVYRLVMNMGPGWISRKLGCTTPIFVEFLGDGKDWYSAEHGFKVEGYKADLLHMHFLEALPTV
jgi:hypothetical protein